MPVLDSPQCQFPLILKVVSGFSENKLCRNRCSADPAAAEDDVAVVENSGLAGGDRALWGIEHDARDGGTERLDCGGRGLVLVADFGEGAKRGGRLTAGNPIDAFDFAYRLPEDIVFADDDAALLRINRENVEGLAGGKAEALALADRKIVNAVVAADHVAVLVDDFSFSALQGNSALLRIRPDELDIVAGGHEAQLHAFRLFRDRQVGAAGQSAHFFLGQLAQGEIASRKLFLREAPEKVGLVLGFVARAPQFPAAGLIVLANSRVVTGGKTLGADLACHAQERLKLYIRIAIGAGDGSAAGEILVHEGTHNARLELLLEVHHVVWKIQVLRYGLGVVDVVERAAAV